MDSSTIYTIYHTGMIIFFLLGITIQSMICQYIPTPLALTKVVIVAVTWPMWVIAWCVGVVLEIIQELKWQWKLEKKFMQGSK